MFERIIKNWPVFRLLIIPICVGVFVATVVLGMPNLYILGKRGVEVEGVITSFDPNENETTYAFSFAGTNYYDRFLYHQGSRPDYPKTGEKLNVTVDPENPSRYNLGNINAQFNQFSDSLKGILFITVGLFLIQLFRLLPNPFSRSDQQGKEEWEKYRKGP